MLTWGCLACWVFTAVTWHVNMLTFGSRVESWRLGEKSHFGADGGSQLARGPTAKARGSQRSVAFILWGPWMWTAPVEIFGLSQSGVVTDRQTDSTSSLGPGCWRGYKSVFHQSCLSSPEWWNLGNMIDQEEAHFHLCEFIVYFSNILVEGLQTYVLIKIIT